MQIFIVGNSRSGTTMLGRVFGLNSQVHTFGELHFFEQCVDADTVSSRKVWHKERLIALLERLLTASRDGYFAKVIPGRYASVAEEILSNVSTLDALSAYAAFLKYESGRYGKSIPCEQTPRYLYYVQEILNAFPDARVINVVRDPRDVLLSQKNKWRRRFLGAANIPLREAIRSWINYHPYIISRRWVSAINVARTFESEPRFVTVKFEDIIKSPESTVANLCGYVGVKFEPNMLNVPKVGSSTGKDQPNQIGIDSSHSGSWRSGGLSSVELGICEQVARQEMRYYGYQLSGVRLSTVRRATSMAAFAIKVAAALLVNMHRTRNLRETLRRRLARNGTNV